MLARALRACALVTFPILRPQNWLSGSSILMQLSSPLVPRKLLSSVPLLLPFPAPGMPSRSHYKPCLWKHQGSASPTTLLHTLSLPQAPSGGLSHPFRAPSHVLPWGIPQFPEPLVSQTGAPGQIYPAGIFRLALTMLYSL